MVEGRQLDEAELVLRAQRGDAARLPGADADVPGSCVQDGVRDRRLGDGGRGGCARRVREGVLGARPVPARQAVSAVAADDRRQRGAQPSPLGGARARARSARGRRGPPERSRHRPPRPPCSGTSGTSCSSQAVNRLPEEQRLVVVCRFILDLGEAETASVLGLRAGTVKSRLSRALDRLREEVPRDD